jgi:hypothetical protein
MYKFSHLWPRLQLKYYATATSRSFQTTLLWAMEDATGSMQHGPDALRGWRLTPGSLLHHLSTLGHANSEVECRLSAAALATGTEPEYAEELTPLKERKGREQERYPFCVLSICYVSCVSVEREVNLESREKIHHNLGYKHCRNNTLLMSFSPTIPPGSNKINATLT